MNKKGLSEVVTNVLIILLVVVAVGVLWGFLSPMFSRTGAKIEVSQACLGIELEIPKCALNPDVTTNVSVTLKRNEQQANIKDVMLIFERADGSTVSAAQTPAPNILGTSVYSGVNAQGVAPTKVSAAAGIVSADGTKSYCTASAKQVCV